MTKCEDEHLAFTNNFTTADKVSVVKLRDEYRCMQHNHQAAAMGEHKKLYDDIPLPLAVQCTVIYTYQKMYLYYSGVKHTLYIYTYIIHYTHTLTQDHSTDRTSEYTL